MIPRLGAPPRPDQRYVSRPGVYAVLLHGDEVLLTHQAEPYPEFQLPGGGVDHGESPFRSLHREVMEETGWTIAKPVHIGTYRRFTWMPEYRLWAEKICHIFSARPALRVGPPTELGHTAVWMPVSTAIETLATEGDRRFLAFATGAQS